MTYNVKDALLTATGALPNGIGSADTTSIDLGHDATGSYLAPGEFLLSAPALVVGDLADGDTMIYDVISSASADLSSPTVVIDNLITQTGAGGAGAVAAEARFRLPTNVQRYIGVTASNSGAGDASDKTMTLELLS